MKTIFCILLVHIFNLVNAQGNSIERVCVDYSQFPPDTYFSDIDGTFNPFIGTWTWENGNQTLSIRLSKITNYYSIVSEAYIDVMVGDYKYSEDGGVTFITNTISTPINNNPHTHPMFGLCPDGSFFKFSFFDIGHQKKYSYAIFENLSTTPPTLRMTLKNPDEMIGILEGQPPIPAGFSIPSDVILTKQN